MAIGIAVDVLGCTGTLEDRAATLNRVIQVAVELKDSMGDLYAFSAIMKALEMPQVRLPSLCTAPWASRAHTQHIREGVSQSQEVSSFVMKAALIGGQPRIGS